jgi:hypothetical protein
MAQPNIVNVTDIKGNTKGYAITNGTTDLLENAAASGKVYRIEYFSVANIDGTNPCDVTINFYDASATTSFKIANTVTVPADATLMVVDKPLYLEEGDKITVLASANGDLEAVISWVVIDD